MSRGKNSVLKARIRVLESDLAEARQEGERRRICGVRSNNALREIGETLATITARAVAADKDQVGGWFAWVTLTTPTLIMLADIAKSALEANLESLHSTDWKP